MRPLFVDSETAYLFTSVLFIGHNPETVDIWARSLSRRWPYYCILKAYSLEYGIEVLRSKEGLDSVVVDVDLHNSGRRALQRMILDWHRAPLGIVGLTAARTTSVDDAALYYGAHACVQKDLFEICDMHGLIQDAIECAWKTRLEQGHSTSVRSRNRITTAGEPGEDRRTYEMNIGNT